MIPHRTEQMVEQRLLKFAGVSLLLHLIALALWLWWPSSKPRISEPTFIDLQDTMLPSTMPAPRAVPSDRTRRVERERDVRPRPQIKAAPAAPQRTPASTGSALGKPSLPPVTPSQSVAPGSSVAGLLKKPSTQAGSPAGQRSAPNLTPSVSRLARLEEQYRRRYADDLDEGSTRFLNTNDIQLGSFLKHFETAVYGVWRYPQEALQKGIEGVTPVKITFNRRGEIINIRLLESSGSKILDEEVIRTLRAIGPVGRLPKNYEKEEFTLIAFFFYGNARGRLR